MPQRRMRLQGSRLNLASIRSERSTPISGSRQIPEAENCFHYLSKNTLTDHLQGVDNVPAG